jgi:hypothetical protein
MTTRRVFMAAVLVGIMVGAAALAQSSDPLVGTWKINPEKTKGAKSGTTVIEAAGQGLKWAVDLVGTDGSTSHWSFIANYDGKDVPITGNSPYGNTVSLTRVDAKTVKLTAKQDGKVTTTSTIVLSADGKTRTTTTKGTDPKGQAVDVMSVYEKQ